MAMTEREAPKKGVVTRLFGVILVSLGMLDTLLSWRGGFAVDEIPVLLIAAGGCLYAVGAIRRWGQTPPLPTSHQITLRSSAEEPDG
jgi:hypothetical protein